MTSYALTEINSRMRDPTIIHFHGAAGTVTGSYFLIETESAQMPVDH